MMTEEIQKVLNDPTIHLLTKQILKEAMTKDALDAYYDVQLAADLLRDRMEWILAKAQT